MQEQRHDWMLHTLFDLAAYAEKEGLESSGSVLLDAIVSIGPEINASERARDGMFARHAMVGNGHGDRAAETSAGPRAFETPATEPFTNLFDIAKEREKRLAAGVGTSCAPG